MKPIEIPPPRPKRKPVRPYPRKSIDSFKGASFTNQVERTPSPNGLVSDNQSPTSVLPAFVSYGLGSGISDQQNRCSSPTSCTTENDYMTSNSSPEEAKSSSGLRTQQSANSTVEEFLPLVLLTWNTMLICSSVNFHSGLNAYSGVLSCLILQKTESQSNHSTGVKEEVRRMQPSPSIKLFGKTVSVTDTQKPYCSGFESSMSPISDNNVVDFETDNGSFRQEIPRKHLDTQLSLGLVSASKSDGEVSPHTNMELSDPAAVACATPAMPVMVLHQGLPVVYLMSDKPTSAGTLMVSNLKVKEGSCAGSSAGSVSDQETRERSSDASVDSQWRQGSTPVGRNPNNCSKGFVPYKRCLAEAEMKSSIASEERERQRARVCS